jgi:MYXO-CTERM domain-containing protein
VLDATILLAIADFRVNEVLPQLGGDGRVRFVELFVPQGTGGNCLFPTTRIEVFDAAGVLIGAVAPFTGTVCYPAGTYFLLASDEAVAAFNVPRDTRFDVPIPPFAGQVCLASSATRYDCARWGPITGPVAYLRNTDDTTSAASIPDGQALARVADTFVVAADFVLQEPTPGQPNDGTVWMGPDAGEAPPDAAPAPDAALPDARIFVPPDAPRPGPRPDGANLDPAFLSADPGGGVMCACRVGAPQRRAPAGPVLLTILGFVALWRRRRP